MEFYNKYKKIISLSNNFRIFELVINIYLIKEKFRNMFQIIVKNEEKEGKVIKILKDERLLYKIFKFDDKTGSRIIVYSKKFNFKTLDTTFGKKFGKQLGNFYFCASDNWQSHTRRVVILVSNNHVSCEIYAQMCNLELLLKNTNKLFKIIDKLQLLLEKLSPDIFLMVQIYKIPTKFLKK